MKKMDISKIAEDFDKEIQGFQDFFKRVSAILEASHKLDLGAGTHQKADMSYLAQTIFLSTYVAFEGFISDLFLAYLNHDPSQYQTFYENAIRHSIKDRFGEWHAAQLKLDYPEHMKVPELREIVDPQAYNLTFRDTNTMKQRAKDWLCEDYRKRLASLSRADELVIDTSRAIRNFISHNSPASKAEMNTLLSKIEGDMPENKGLGRGTNEIGNIGSFLKATVSGSESRLSLYQQRLREIAKVMSLER